MLHLSFVAALLSLIDTAAVYIPYIYSHHTLQHWGDDDYNYSLDYVVKYKILILKLMRGSIYYICKYNNQRTDR